MLCKYGCGQEGIFQLKTGERICSDSPNKCPINRNLNSKRQKINYKFPSPQNNPANVKIDCKYCDRKISLSSLNKHLKSCHLNPKNLKLCPVCNNPIDKDYKNKMTCSNKCSKIYFYEKYKNYGKIKWKWRVKNESYRDICFKDHKKCCVICGENLIVAVHHYDEKNNNNDPENLIPLCPTHHIYIHSKYKFIIKECIDEYIHKFKKNQKRKELK